MNLRFSLSTNIILSLLLGVACGIFFGEYCSGLRVVGDAFIKLLQMSILPFIVVSLIAGMGKLSHELAKILAIRASTLLLLFWSIVFTLILLMPLSFPALKTASFFSVSAVQAPESINFLDLFIPANPFRSMAETVVPSVVLFSIVVGVALIGIKEKEGLIKGLSTLSAALTQVARFVVYLTPIGVFAIAASTAGTMTVEEFGRLQVYLVTYTVAAVLLSFWILPKLLSTITPFKYRDLLDISKSTLITGFTTGNLFIILPLLIENCKDLFQQYRLKKDETEPLVDIIIPVFFNFPTIGGLLILVFIPFAAWFSSTSFPIQEYPSFVFSGLLSMFGGAPIAIPFLLDTFRIPSDLFQLFVASKVITDRFATLLAGMYLLIFTLMTICSIRGLLTVRWEKLLRYMVLTAAIVSGTIITARIFFTKALEFEYTKYQSFVEMELRSDPVPTKVHKSLPAVSPHEGGQTRSRLDEIVRRGSLRVGYFKDSLPFAFTNKAGNLVGFDIEMAHLLARDLSVSLELVLIKRERAVEMLNTGYCDIIMSGIAITPQGLRDAAFSEPYLDTTIAFIVRDYRRDEFNSREAVQSLDAPRIAIPNLPYYIAKLKQYLPQAKIVPLSSPREFFRTDSEKIDAFLFTAEAGSAWTLVYPEYAVAVPLPDVIKVPLAYPTVKGDREITSFINGWIVLKRNDETIEKLYDHWILGRGAEKKEPRWSIIRNVLHWVE